MDGKRIRKRVYFLFHLTCVLSLIWIFPACTRLPSTLLGEYYFDQASGSTKEIYFQKSLEQNQAILERFPDMLGDQALYRMGVIYIHPENQNADLKKGLETFQRILDEYPSSSLREKARLWVLILQEINRQEEKIVRLNEEMDLLQKILQKRQETIQSLLISKDKEKENLQKENESMKIQLESLKEQMENLKKIDLRIEEKKRQLNP